MTRYWPYVVRTLDLRIFERKVLQAYLGVMDITGSFRQKKKQKRVNSYGNA